MKTQVAIIVAVAMATLLGAGEAHAQPRWFDLYDQAIEHARIGEWPDAESKLRQAQKLGPSPGRNVLRYGMMRDDFFPDFYLGVVFLNTNRPTDALRQFALARAQNLNVQDREFQVIADLENRARSDERRMAAFEAAALPAVKPVPADPPPSLPPAGVETTAAAPPMSPERRQLENSIDAALTRRDLNAARTALGILQSLDAAAADRFAGRVTALDRDLRLAASERDAMRWFFAGDYQQAVATLDQIERELATRLSARGHFYRACALAGLALRSSRVDTPMLETARRQYAEASADAQGLAADRRYVSPRILEALAR